MALYGTFYIAMCAYCYVTKDGEERLGSPTEEREGATDCSTFFFHLMPDYFNLKFYTLGLWLWLVYVPGQIELLKHLCPTGQIIILHQNLPSGEV